MEKQLVVFELADEQYGLDITTVESIIKMQPITKMPHAPSFLEGITNLRGVVVPVMDLRRRFGLESKPADRDTRIVVANMNDTQIGIVVDAVSQVLRIQDEAIEPPPSLSTTIDSSFISGIAKLDDQLVILLDHEKILSTEEQTKLASVA